MRKIFTLLIVVLFAAQNISAQRNMYVVSKSGTLTAYSAQKVFLHDDIFTFTYDEASNISMKRFTASFNVEVRDTLVKSLSETPEVGICISRYNNSPTIYDGKLKSGTSITSFKKEISDLEKGTTYYYRAYVKLCEAVVYGDVQQVTTLGDKQEDGDFFPLRATAAGTTSTTTARTATAGQVRWTRVSSAARTASTSAVATTTWTATAVTMATPSVPSQNPKMRVMRISESDLSLSSKDGEEPIKRVNILAYLMGRIDGGHQQSRPPSVLP